jgi:acyl-CoA reductase-like NAD-dependent aldehyde dehydrogenase
VFTDRHSRAMEVADAVDAGTVRVNGARADDHGPVGLDRETAAAAISRLTHTSRVRD